MNKHRSNPKRDNEPKKAQDYTSEVLKLAKDAAVKLSQQKIKYEEDCAIMATNLGAMFETVKRNAKERGHSFSLTQLFNEAFGEKNGESAFKKRSMVISLSSDKKAGDKFYRHGQKYLEIAKTLSRHMELPIEWSSQKKGQVAISRMIEGTTFDYLGGYAERAANEYRSELDKQLKRLIDRVVDDKQTNLDWMRQWAEDHPISVVGEVGTLDELHLADWTSRGHSGHIGGLNTSHNIANSLAPCVRIASILVDCPVDKYLPIEVKKNHQKTTMHAIQEAVLSLIGQPYLEEWEREVAIISEEKIDTLKQHGRWQTKWDLGHRFVGLKQVWFIDLEIRFDEDMATWRPMILLRPRSLNLVGDPYESLVFATQEPGLYGEIHYSSEMLPLFFTDDDDGADAVMAGKSHDSGDSGLYYLYTERDFEYNYSPPDNIGDLWAESGFCSPHPGFYNSLFKSTPILGRNELKTKIATATSEEYVKAPTGSLAHCILGNLAYATDAARIDQLLIQDARFKYKKLREFAAQCEKQYAEAIDKA